MIDREGRAKTIGDFMTTSVDQVVFVNDPRLRPGPRSQPVIDTVTLSGVGYWNGAPGHTFTVQASDAGEAGRGRDLITVTIRSPRGIIVASVSGALTGGTSDPHAFAE